MLRTLTLTDIDEFIRLRRDGFRRAPLSFDHDPDTVIDREKLLADWQTGLNEENFILGYFVEDRLVGIVGLLRERRAKRCHRAMVWGFYVDADYHGRGIGRRLMEELIARAGHISGLERLYLTVSDKAPAAFALYRKLGFEEFGREADAARTGEVSMTEVYMQRPLSEF